MEVIKEGSVNVVVPKGGRLRKQDSVMLIETADEYAARKFKDTDDRFKKLEKELEAQRRELENTGKELRDLKSVVINSSEEDGRKKLPIPAILKQNALDDS